MTNEQLLTIIISILTATIALGGLILGQSRAMRRKMTRMESRLGSRMERIESRLSGRIDGLESQIRGLRDRMGRIEGTLNVIREFFLRPIRSQTGLMQGPSRAIDPSQEETRTPRQSYSDEVM